MPSASTDRRLALVACLIAACTRTESSAGAPPAADVTAPLRAHIAELQRELERVESERDALAGRAQPDCAALAREIESLHAELARELERRIEREREWSRYQEGLRSLELGALESGPKFEAEVRAEDRPAAESAPVVDEAAAAARRDRSLAIGRSLRALLAVEGVRGIDLLEAGVLGEGWIGPVVFRLLDEHGRLAGSLFAERLRLEGSRAGRTLSIVLEEGYESRSGVRSDFAAAPDSPTRVRTIELLGTDPMPWVNAMPELFGSADLGAPLDDGTWDLARVREALDLLLREDASTGYWHLESLGGVSGATLRDVHLSALDAQGRVERRVFADRLTIHRQERGMLLILEDGAHIRGSDKAPFLEGRFRIFLPRASPERWQAAGLPGLAAPASAAPEGDAEAPAGAPKSG